MVDHTIAHFEIPADDVEKLRRFYSELFGWKIEKTAGPVDYRGIACARRSMMAKPEIPTRRMRIVRAAICRDSPKVFLP